MQQRNRLLADGVRDGARFDGLERVMAETGVAIAAARAEAVAELLAAIGRARAPRDPALAVSLGASSPSTARSKRDLARTPAVDVEDAYVRSAAPTGASATAPPAARSTARTAPIWSSAHGPKAMPAQGSARPASRRRC